MLSVKYRPIVYYNIHLLPLLIIILSICYALQLMLCCFCYDICCCWFLFFLCLKVRVMVMISAINIVAFMMVHLSVIAIVRLISSVSRNTTIPATANTIAVINQVVLYCVIFPLSLSFLLFLRF